MKVDEDEIPLFYIKKSIPASGNPKSHNPNSNTVKKTTKKMSTKNAEIQSDVRKFSFEIIDRPESLSVKKPETVYKTKMVNKPEMVNNPEKVTKQKSKLKSLKCAQSGQLKGETPKSNFKKMIGYFFLPKASNKRAVLGPIPTREQLKASLLDPAIMDQALGQETSSQGTLVDDYDDIFGDILSKYAPDLAPPVSTSPIKEKEVVEVTQPRNVGINPPDTFDPKLVSSIYGRDSAFFTDF